MDGMLELWALPCLTRAVSSHKLCRWQFTHDAVWSSTLFVIQDRQMI